jgi:hypothetical protein
MRRPPGSMQWSKQGRILEPSSSSLWYVSHAALPFVDPIEANSWRLYFSGRDSDNRSHTGVATIEVAQGTVAVSHVDTRPVLSPGRLGSFDDSGAMGCWLVSANGRKYLYYIGWNRGVTVPFRNAVGLAVSDDDGRSFVRCSEGPILDRSAYDPFSTGSVCVLVENDTWRMWYLSCVEWVVEDGRPKHRYHIKYAESSDGVRWHRTGLVAIDFRSHDEYAISRPSVLKDGRVYRMWYSYRGDAYRIGYAESDDGFRWRRDDEHAGIEPGPDAWDSQMIAYPFVFDAGDYRYMLYNGNDYGRTGIGFATLDGQP